MYKPNINVGFSQFKESRRSGVLHSYGFKTAKILHHIVAMVSKPFHEKPEEVRAFPAADWRNKGTYIFPHF